MKSVQLAGHALDDATGIRGTVDTRQLRADLRKLAQSHQEHAAVIEQLQAQLSDTMPRAEVEQLLREALVRVDERLSKLEREVSRHNSELESHARRLGLHDDEVAQLKQQQAAHYQELGQRIAQQSIRVDGHDREITSMQGTLGRHQVELSRHAGELSTLQQRSMRHSARLDQHEAGIHQLNDEFADLRRDYPRINPQRQGALLAASGAKALERGDLAEAARCFHLGKATNPIDPAMAYGLAVVMHRQNRDQEADAAVARGIILEREHGAQKRTGSLLTGSKDQIATGWNRSVVILCTGCIHQVIWGRWRGSELGHHDTCGVLLSTPEARTTNKLIRAR